MATKLTIENLKNIQHLEFDIPPRGAYLLTGSNGSGKTSLLTCLSRLRNNGAFQRGFRSSVHPSLDSHRGASVKYEINGDSVTYTYVEERWAPLPRRNSGLLANCGYPEVKYIAADGDRVEPKKDEFAPRSVRLTGQPLRDDLNNIFSTKRFDELCYINLNRGGQNKAYLIRQTRQGKPTLYFSERNFSLGELCVLKLLLALEDIVNASLVLIDELELAVHPRAQSKLFHHLVKIAKEKDLTIIFSTHSVTLIKTTDRRKILFLQGTNGNVVCRKGCYPTFALGQISGGEEVAPDCVIYVEDDSAKKCTEAMIQLYRRQMNPLVAQPTVVVVPLGGFSQILEFMDKAPQLLPANTKVMALLDEDVQTESLAAYNASEDHYMLSLFQRLNGSVGFLPWTPEVGFIELIQQAPEHHENGLKEYFADQRFVFPENWLPHNPGNTPAQIRKSNKASIFALCESLQNLLGKPNDRIREGLFDYLVQQTSIQGAPDLIGLIGRTIHT
jgi:energy-coupling factor transporter ATP-binding protein EcfA2